MPFNPSDSKEKGKMESKQCKVGVEARKAQKVGVKQKRPGLKK